MAKRQIIKILVSKILTAAIRVRIPEAYKKYQFFDLLGKMDSSGAVRGVKTIDKPFHRIERVVNAACNLKVFAR